MKPESDSAAGPKPVTCPNCGYVELPKYRQTCARCGAWIAPDYYRLLPYWQRLPTRIKFYIGILNFGAIASILGACLSLLLAMISDEIPIPLPLPLLSALVFVGLAVLLSITAGGLYRMRSWGRTLALMLLVIGIVVNGLACVNLYFDSVKFSSGLSPMCGSIIGIPIQAYILDWLLTNRHRFQD